MKTSASTRLLTSIVAIFSMLFMQLAVASYACPGNSRGSLTPYASLNLHMADMPNCEGMDPAQPSLCHMFAHGEPSKQSLDKSPILDIQPFIPLALAGDVQLAALPVAQDIKGYVTVTLLHTAAPPIAIRHCCFRC